MFEKDKPALALARRQKRLEYWQKSFSQINLSSEQQETIDELLRRYSLLISKLAKPSADTEAEETSKHLLAVEQEITAIFNSSQLLTSSLNTKSLSSTSMDSKLITK